MDLDLEDAGARMVDDLAADDATVTSVTLGQAYISRNLLRNLMLWLDKKNFPKYTVPGGWVEEIFQNISYMGVAPPPIFPK